MRWTTAAACAITGRNGRGGEDGMNFLVKIFTWWNGQTIGTQFFTWRKGRRVGEDSRGQHLLPERRRLAALGDLQRRGRGEPGRAGVARLAASYLPGAADGGAAAAQGLGAAARAEHDRQRARLSAAGKHPRGRAGRCSRTTRPGCRSRGRAMANSVAETVIGAVVLAAAAGFVVYAGQSRGAAARRRQLSADRELPQRRGHQRRHRRAGGGDQRRLGDRARPRPGELPGQGDLHRATAS